MTAHITVPEKLMLLTIANRLLDLRRAAESEGRTWVDGHLGIFTKAGPRVLMLRKPAAHGYTPEVTVTFSDAEAAAVQREAALAIAAELLDTHDLEVELTDPILHRYTCRKKGVV